MMKVKPFSYHYHIPRRKAYIITTSFFSESSNNKRNCSSYTCGINRGVSRCNAKTNGNSTTLYSSSLFSLCRTGGTVLTLILLGFIGVAGQGKLEDDSRSSFSTHNQFPVKSLNYRAFDEGSGEDHVIEGDSILHEGVATMGPYGISAKYRNDTHNYSTSSHPYSYYDRFGREYKHEHIIPGIDTFPESFRESIFLSLHEDEYALDPNDSKTTDSFKLEGIDENVITVPSSKALKSERKEKMLQGDSKDGENEKRVIVRTDITKYTENKESPKSSDENRILQSTVSAKAKILLEKSSNLLNNGNDGGLLKVKEGHRDLDEDLDKSSVIPIPKKSSVDDEDYEYDDQERFTPDNSSHTSGKFRFRQSSQAEIDSLEKAVNPVLSSGSVSRRRPRRSVVHLYDMVVCSTGCNPLIFKGYGCYCGFLGSGLTVDGIDKCCAKHDFCYGNPKKCPPLLSYFVPYYWRCHDGHPVCVTDFRGWKGICGAHLCECDRQFAECLKKFPCPRSRAMCITSPFSPWHKDPRAFPFAISRRPRPPWRPSRIPLLPYPQVPFGEDEDQLFA